MTNVLRSWDGHMKTEENTTEQAPEDGGQTTGSQKRRGRRGPAVPWGAWPGRYLDFALSASRTVTQYISVASGHPVCSPGQYFYLLFVILLNGGHLLTAMAWCEIEVGPLGAGLEFKGLRLSVTWDRDMDIDFWAKWLFFIRSCLGR